MSNVTPRMLEVRQSYPPSPRLDLQSLIVSLREAKIDGKIAPGMKIAVGVGSRGITNLKEIVHTVLGFLASAGANPYIVPAMGSHGGATPDGQKHVLAEYGVTETELHVPIDADMNVRSIGTTPDGRDVVLSEAALKSDGIVVINRVKPHTDFRGKLGSGIQKMLAIGLGKQIGAANAHRAAVRLGHERVIREAAGVILEKAPVLCGVAILEDQHHRTAEIRVLPAESIAREEDVLFERSRSLMPRLPLDEIDLLIVDRIGKEISGAGMDTNVIGRGIEGYSTLLRSESPYLPRIFRIVVRDLSHETGGNGIGLGLADFTTTRAVKALDLRTTYMNAITAIGIQPGKIPIHFDTDREAIEVAIRTLSVENREALRVIRIADTLSLDRMLMSERCANELAGHPGITRVDDPREMQFDVAGNLLPF